MNTAIIWATIQTLLKETPTLAIHIQNPQDYGKSSLKFPYITIDLKDTGKNNGLPKGYFRGYLKLILSVFSKSHNPLEIMGLMEKVQETLIGTHKCTDNIILEITFDQTNMVLEKGGTPPPLRHGILEFDMIVES